MKKQVFSILFLAVFLLSTGSQSQHIFRLIDPEDRQDEFGKSPTAGPPYLRFTSTDIKYHTSGDYSGHTSAVEAAFSSWNSTGPIDFERESGEGILVYAVTPMPDAGPDSTAYAQEGIPAAGNAYPYQNLNYEIIPSESYIWLNRILNPVQKS